MRRRVSDRFNFVWRELYQVEVDGSHLMVTFRNGAARTNVALSREQLKTIIEWIQRDARSKRRSADEWDAALKGGTT